MSKNAVMPLSDYVAACDKVREKTGTTDLIKSGELADKVEDVYNAEWEKIKGTVSGNPIRIDDISPIEHEMSVKVSGVEDLSTVKVSKYGRNLLDFPSVYSWNGAFYAHQHTNVKTVLKPNVEYVLCYDKVEYSKQGDGLVIIINGKQIVTDAWGNKPWYFTLDKEVTEFYMYTNGWNAVASSTTTATVKNLRIYVAETDYLEYEPYIEPITYTADENGIVSGVTSIYPTTTLMTDTDGAVIEATYNRDISKVEDVPERIDAAYENGVGDGEEKMLNLMNNFGKRYTFNEFFGNQDWSNYTFPNNYFDKTKTIYRMFYNYQGTELPKGVYFGDALKNTTLDYSHYANLFSWATNITEIYDMNIPALGTLEQTYSNCHKLKRIEKIRVSETTGFSWGVFQSCTELEDVTFEGVIGQSGLAMDWSTKLTHDSLMNVINCLMAYVVAENKELTATANSTVLKDAKLIEGKVYSMQYKSREYDQAQTTISTLAEFSQDMTASVINIPNVGERVGVWQQCAHWADPDINWYKVYIYQDGDDIKELRCIVDKQTGEAHALVYDGDVLSIKVDQTATHSVTLGATNLNKLTDAEKAIATQKGWSLV